jgi:membrane-associated phospholipid phosphatase
MPTSNDHRRISPLAVLAIGLALAAILLPFDGAISRAVTAARPAGDLRRELEILQQFGSISTIAVASLLIWRLDPARVRRLGEWLLAAVLTWAAVFALKITFGRPRPKFPGEHLHFLGPTTTYVVQEGDPPRHAWEFWHDDVTEIWSMPSSHTAFAVVAAVALSRLYPRLTPIMVAAACAVGGCRVLFKAHYPSDVIVGALLGFLIAHACFHHAWASRAGPASGA